MDPKHTQKYALLIVLSYMGLLAVFWTFGEALQSKNPRTTIELLVCGIVSSSISAVATFKVPRLWKILPIICLGLSGLAILAACLLLLAYSLSWI